MGRIFRLTVVYISSNSCWTKNTQLLDDFFIPMMDLWIGIYFSFFACIEL